LFIRLLVGVDQAKFISSFVAAAQNAHLLHGQAFFFQSTVGSFGLNSIGQYGDKIIH
jgi:hypothetical protein